MAGLTHRSNREAVMRQFNKNVGKCLNVLGLEFVRLSGAEADGLIYDAPLSTTATGRPTHERTGDYRRGLMYQANIGGKTVYVGVDQSIFYAIFLELGTWKMAKRPVITNTMQNNKAVWREIIADILSEGF